MRSKARCSFLQTTRTLLTGALQESARWQVGAARARTRHVASLRGPSRQGDGCRCARVDLCCRRSPRTPGAPCPDEERPRQAGLLACGSAPIRPPSQDRYPNGDLARWLTAYSCRGSPGFAPEFPFDPRERNLSRRWAYCEAAGGASVGQPPRPVRRSIGPRDDARAESWPDGPTGGADRRRLRPGTSAC